LLETEETIGLLVSGVRRPGRGKVRKEKGKGGTCLGGDKEAKTKSPGKDGDKGFEHEFCER